MQLVFNQILVLILISLGVYYGFNIHEPTVHRNLVPDTCLPANLADERYSTTQIKGR
jgi:hypothetical protein